VWDGPEPAVSYSSEMCATSVPSIWHRDATREQVLLEVRAGSKGGKSRNVPIPWRMVAAVDADLAERAQLYGATSDGSNLVVRQTGVRSRSSRVATRSQ
jgi:hypothetical protein